VRDEIKSDAATFVISDGEQKRSPAKSPFIRAGDFVNFAEVTQQRLEFCEIYRAIDEQRSTLSEPTFHESRVPPDAGESSSSSGDAEAATAGD
jgi:hypothetical protein